jgi:hypothetical protein
MSPVRAVARVVVDVNHEDGPAAVEAATMFALSAA